MSKSTSRLANELRQSTRELYSTTEAQFLRKRHEQKRLFSLTEKVDLFVQEKMRAMHL